MSYTKKNVFFAVALIISSSFIVSMDPPEDQDPRKNKQEIPSEKKSSPLQKIKKTARKMLHIGSTGDAVKLVLNKEMFAKKIDWEMINDFRSLPADIQKKIINYLHEYEIAKNINTATQSINLLYLPSFSSLPALGFLNDISFCYSVIKNISDLFKTNNMNVCKSFTAPLFKSICENQQELFKICYIRQHEEAVNRFYRLARANPHLDLDFSNADNETPLELCASHLNIPLTKAILKQALEKKQFLNISETLKKLLYVPSAKNYPMISLLLGELKSNLASDIDSFKKILSSLLLISMGSFQSIIIKLLLKAGADPNYPAENGDIPYQKAASQSWVLDIFNEFLEEQKKSKEQ